MADALWPISHYTADRAATIQQGDLVILSLAARTPDVDGIYAAATWVAYVGDVVPTRYASAFEVVESNRRGQARGGELIAVNAPVYAPWTL